MIFYPQSASWAGIYRAIYQMMRLSGSATLVYLKILQKTVQVSFGTEADRFV